MKRKQCMKAIALNPSTIQKHIAETCLNCKNCLIIVNANPGSGKTLTITMCAHVYAQQNKHTLVIAYSRKLQADTLRNAEKYGVSKMSVFTLHALLGYLTQQECINDQQFRYLLENVLTKEQIESKLGHISLIALDEQQDIRESYFKFHLRLLQVLDALSWRLYGHIVNRIVVGDSHQSIYGFLGANPDFLSNAGSLYWTDVKVKMNVYEIPLHNSYRLTPIHAQFVNAICCRNDNQKVIGMNTNVLNSSVQVDLVNFGNLPRLKTALKKILNSPNVSKAGAAGDIMILSRSTKTSPIRQLVHSVIWDRKKGKNWHLNGSSGDFMFCETADDFKGKKNTLQTFHASKGRESKVVIILNQGHFITDNIDDKNMFFVACTRSSGGLLYIIHDVRTQLSSLNPHSEEVLSDLQNKMGPNLIVHKFDTFLRPKINNFEVLPPRPIVLSSPWIDEKIKSETLKYVKRIPLFEQESKVVEFKISSKLSQTAHLYIVRLAPLLALEFWLGKQPNCLNQSRNVELIQRDEFEDVEFKDIEEWKWYKWSCLLLFKNFYIWDDPVKFTEFDFQIFCNGAIELLLQNFKTNILLPEIYSIEFSTSINDTDMQHIRDLIVVPTANLKPDITIVYENNMRNLVILAYDSINDSQRFHASALECTDPERKNKVFIVSGHTGIIERIQVDPKNESYMFQKFCIK